MSGKAVRVLVVEDNLEDYEILRILFSKVKHGRYELENAIGLSAALEKLRLNKHDAFLVDYKLGADSGMDFLRKAIHEEKCQAPIILLTGFNDYELDIEAMSLGAADFLNKNKLDTDMLERSVRYALDRKRAEELQSQLAVILLQTADAVVGIDLEGKVTSFNRGAEKMLGYEAAEIVGQSATRLTLPELIDEAKLIWERTVSGEANSNYETLWVKKTGEHVDVEITLSPIRNAKDSVVGVSVIGRDITSRKQVLATLQKQEEQLRLSQKMDAIGRLAGGVAHDFNNLLSVIGGNVEFLLDSIPKDSPENEELNEVQKAVRQGAELTKQLLVFGKKQVSQPQSLNLNEVSQDMNKMFKRLIDATIDLSIIQGKDLKPIQADLGQIQQVLLNLVLNARDAMPRGGRLLIETKNVTEVSDLEQGFENFFTPQTRVRLNVTDTGMGMTPEIQAHIFEPFFTTKEGKGTGLGLATVYAIVKNWEGSILVHSIPNIGTTFSLTFPAHEAVEKTQEKAKQQSLIPVGSETILVTEDEEGVRKVLVRALEKQGYKVLQAENGQEGVRRAAGYSDKIDLLLTDTVMPKMNGKELADEVRKFRPKMKVIFISGYAQEILSQQGILDSSIHLIQKPFDLDFMVREVRRILDEK
ncbi:MAG TPA: response regulator [bacterium]|jgi:two-component system cell cycle sensor histidine kinase/response regulator CckA|nr:response regulator [bacterium]